MKQFKYIFIACLILSACSLSKTNNTTIYQNKNTIIERPCQNVTADRCEIRK